MASERHYHDASCWERYEPCGEHHAHTYYCGGGVLKSSCPQYRQELATDVRIIIHNINSWNQDGRDHLRRLEECAEKLGDTKLLDAVRTLRTWREVKP